ncbi:hypothetical protein [Paraburkholderia sp. HD33-4]|uniref:hypothetical protein n=1 Tax=Paraburkholderia sp. HD33-4 TaxID=2883242 RepID=UPI001F32358C|nr:hypothetical protein [Paraburkholderia sp. HD33-4]
MTFAWYSMHEYQVTPATLKTAYPTSIFRLSFSFYHLHREGFSVKRQLSIARPDFPAWRSSPLPDVIRMARGGGALMAAIF